MVSDITMHELVCEKCKTKNAFAVSSGEKVRIECDGCGELYESKIDGIVTRPPKADYSHTYAGVRSGINNI